MGQRTSRIMVPFQGEGAGAGELTWGQQGIWLTMKRTGRTMNIGGVMPVGPETPIDEFVGVLRFLLSRHPSLRTTLHTADGDLPRQVVAASGEAPLDVLDIDAADDAAEAAEALRTTYEFTPFDHAREWPVRMGVVRQNGVLTHFVVQYSHMAVDGFGIDAAVRDLAYLDRSSGGATTGARGVRPLDLAAKQHGAAGARQSEKSLHYWESVLRAIPASRFDGPGDPQETRFWEIVCHSPAMFLALQAIAARTRADTGHVLLAAYAVALARITGRTTSVAQVLVNNRFRPGFADSVSHLTQTGICAIDVAGRPFDDVVREAFGAATKAHLHGYYDTLAYHALISRVAAERGEDVDISCYVNDRRAQGGPQTADTPPSAERIRAALPDTVIRWDRRLPTYDGSFYLHVDSSPGAVEFAIWADTHCLSPAQIEACARELENVTVQGALDPAAAAAIGSDRVRAPLTAST